MEIMSHGTSIPLETNGFSLDSDVKDDWGLPALRTTYKDHPDDLKLATWLNQRGLELLDAAGAKQKWSFPIEEQSFGVHLLGTCRMGNDPKTSVVNADHRTHDVKNLFLCDGGSFVTSGSWAADDDDRGAGVSRGGPDTGSGEARRNRLKRKLENKLKMEIGKADCGSVRFPVLGRLGGIPPMFLKECASAFELEACG